MDRRRDADNVQVIDTLEKNEVMLGVEWHDSKRKIHLSFDQMSTFSKLFLFLSFRCRMAFRSSTRECYSRIVLVFHFIYFASSPSEIILFFFRLLLCDLSSVSCLFLSWWHRSENEGVACAFATHAETTNTFYTNFIIRFSFICLVVCAVAPGQWCFGCCFPAAFIFIVRISPEHRK